MNNKNVALIVVVALILAGLVYWFMRPSNEAIAPIDGDLNTESQEVVDPNTEPATSSLPPTKNSILVSAQIAGEFVVIDDVYLETPGFVVIHKANNGAPGDVIGKSAVLNPGVIQDIEISSIVEAEMEYYAMLYSDNGDRIFNASTDMPLQGSNGQNIMARFQVSN